MPRWRALRFIVFLALTGLVLSAVATVFFFEGVLHPPRKQLAANDRERARTLAGQHGAGLESVEVTAADGVTLRGWYFGLRSGNGDTVIVLHGVADNRAGMFPYIGFLLRNGYNVLAPDARAHGESEGLVATYGVHEAGDVRVWTEWLRAEHPARCLFGLGESMGAAILLQALRVDAGFCAVVAESSFASFREVAFDYCGRPFHVGPWLGRYVLRPAIEAGIIYARIRHGADMTRASPGEAVAEANIPVLLIHGGHDDNIPPRHSQILQRRNPASLRLWIVPDAGHSGAIGAEPDVFERRVTEWFQWAGE